MNDKLTFWQKLAAYAKATRDRWNQDSPRYWQTVRTFLNWLMGVTLLLSDYGQYIIEQITGYGLDVPDWFMKVMGHVTTAAFFARLIAQLTVNPESIPRAKYEKLINPTEGLKPKANEPA